MKRVQLVGVKARGQPVDHHVVDVALDHLTVLVVRGERMPVGHEEVALLVLQLHPVLQGAVIVAQVQGAGGAHARDNAGWRWARR